MKPSILFAFLLFICFGCSDNEPGFIEEEETDRETPVENPDENPETPEEPEETYEVAGEIEFYDENLISEGYVLVNDVGFNRVYMINKDKAEIRYEWELEQGIGNDAELLENSDLLVSLIAEDVAFSFGGFGGLVQLVAPDNTVKWEYEINTTFELGHHDVEELPNGNILILVWEGKLNADARETFGYAYDDEVIYAEKLIEVNPATNEIVWEWSSWDHTIQEDDVTKSNYGLISENPQRIDLNYRDALRDGSYNGDIMHANGIEYDAQNDLIYISVNFYSEVWVLDHSTTTEEAALNTGGNRNKGGDLVYRFGNPETYNNSQGTRMFFYNHGINKIANTEHILIYANGGLGGVTQSVVYELALPDAFVMQPDTDNELEEVWSFTDPDLFAPRVSGAYRLSNGNTLITEGDYGCWEVTENQEIAWKYKGTGFTWRAYAYDKDDAVLDPFDLQ